MEKIILACAECGKDLNDSPVPRPSPVEFMGPDQGFDVDITTYKGGDPNVSFKLPPMNDVHIDVAIHRVIGLLAILEDMRTQYAKRPMAQ